MMPMILSLSAIQSNLVNNGSTVRYLEMTWDYTEKKLMRIDKKGTWANWEAIQ